MSMRCHIFLAEHYRLMCLLLENREAALYGKFVPAIADSLNSYDPLKYNDKIAIAKFATEHNDTTTMPVLTHDVQGNKTLGDSHSVEIATLVNQSPAFVAALLPEQQQARREAIAAEIVKMIWDADPNPKKAYATWMLYRFMAKDENNRLSLEDLPRTRGYLELFDKVKNHRELKHKLKINDINRFKSTNDLFDAIMDFRENENGEVVSDDYVKRMYKQAMVIYEGDDYEIVRPLTKDSSIWFGRGTEWCTAYAPPKTNNMFNHYASDGALYIVKEKSSGKRWQFYVPDSQNRHAEYRDARDASIDIHAFLRDHPTVDQAFDKFFKADKWEQVDDIFSDSDHSNNTCVVWFGPEGDGYGIRVAPEGKKFTGLVRDAALMSINLDKDMNVIVATGAIPYGEDRFRKVLTALKVKGNCAELTEENMVWRERGGWGTLFDLKPFMAEGEHGELIDNRMFARRVPFKPNNEIYYGSFVSGIEKSEHDLFTIRVEDGQFRIDHHLSYQGLDEDQQEFLAKVLLSEDFDEEWTFLPKESNVAIPAVKELADARPQWMDLGNLYEATGATLLVRKRILKLLKDTVDETFDYRMVPGSQHEVIVDQHKDALTCAAVEGDQTAQWCAKLAEGKAEFGGNDHVCPPHDYHEFFGYLEKHDKGLFERLCRYMEKTYSEEMSDIELSKIETARDLETLQDEVDDDDLKHRLNWAYSHGCERGAETEAVKALHKAMESNDHILFQKGEGVSGDFEYDVPVFITATIEDILSFGDAGSIDTDGLHNANELGHGRWLKQLESPITVYEPRYGFMDYDEDAAFEDFEWRIEEMLKEHDA